MEPIGRERAGHLIFSGRRYVLALAALAALALLSAPIAASAVPYYSTRALASSGYGQDYCGPGCTGWVVSSFDEGGGSYVPSAQAAAGASVFVVGDPIPDKVNLVAQSHAAIGTVGVGALAEIRDSSYWWYATNASAGGGASWNDTLTIVSDTLPIGTDVWLGGTMSLVGWLEASPIGLAWAGADVSFILEFDNGEAHEGGYGRLGSCWAKLGYIDPGPGVPCEKTFEVRAAVGEYLALRGVLGAGAGAHAIYGSPDMRASANFLGTGTVTLQSLTPGAWFVSAGGGTYSGPAPVSVPEPPALVLVGFGLLVLAGIGWRRRRSR